MAENRAQPPSQAESRPSSPAGQPTPQPHSQPPELPERLPSWYREIFPAGPCDGFFQKIGEHSLSFVDRGSAHLVISFDNLSDAGYPGYDREPWAGKFVRERGLSHLGVYSQGPSWFREARLIARLEALRSEGFFARFRRVTLCGTSMGGFAALAFADLAEGADVLALSPQSTLDPEQVPWETRFARGRARDWSLPHSDGAAHLGRAGRVWVVYDPFLQGDRDQVARLPQDRITPLRAFGMGHKTAVVLRRMEQLKAVMGAALDGDLSPALFYRLIRARHDVYLYRRVMEDHLLSRGKGARIPQLTAAFRARRMAQAEAAGPDAEAEPDAEAQTDPEVPGGADHPAPDASGAPEAPADAPTPAATPEAQPQSSARALHRHSAPVAQHTAHNTTPQAPDQDLTALPSSALPPSDPGPNPAPTWDPSAGPDRGQPPRRPRSLGNIWQLSDDGQALRYLSDQYRHQVMGFEERDGVTLAQTPPVALAMVALGQEVGVPRPLPERFEYHLSDELLSPDMPPQGAQSLAVLSLLRARQSGRAWRSVIALSLPRPGLRPQELPDAGHEIAARLEEASVALADWGKTLFVDRLQLALLDASATMTEAEAAAFYAQQIAWLRPLAARATGQGSLPAVVLSQGAGGRTRGDQGAILAEGRLELTLPDPAVVVAAPAYPMALMPETAQTLAPQDRLLLDELETLAVEARLDGQPWYCPMLRQFQRSETAPGAQDGDALEVEFASMGPLELSAPGYGAPACARLERDHGFALEGCENGARITAAELIGPQRLRLSCDRRPEGAQLAIRYAWGARRAQAQGAQFANQGGLRECWQAPSLAQPGRLLHRYALAGRLALMARGA